MKHIVKYLICLVLLPTFSCEDDNNLLEDIAIRGGFIQFVETPNTEFNLSELNTATVSASLVDPNNNATRYSLTLSYDGTEVDDFVVIESFPAQLTISVSDAIVALGITNADVDADTEFNFVATVVTPTGTFVGTTPRFEDGVNTGGDTASRLRSTTVRDAVEFDITFTE